MATEPNRLPPPYLLQATHDGVTTLAAVTPAWGANVVALSVRHRDWAWPVPVLETVDLATLAAKPTSFGMPLLAPTPGRVGRDQSGIITYRGREHRLRPSRHGFLRGLPWQVVGGGADRLVCAVEIDPAREDRGFPFHFRAEHEVALVAGGLRSRVRLENLGSRPQPLDVGWHPYLQCSGPCRVRIPARGRWRLDGRPEPTPTGEVAPVGPEDDFRAGREVPEDEHWDDVFTDLVADEDDGGGATSWVEQRARVRAASGEDLDLRLRRYVRVDLPAGRASPPPVAHVQLYTAPGRDAISIEPLSAPPNAINLRAQGHDRARFCEVAPGDSASFEITVGLRVADG